MRWFFFSLDADIRLLSFPALSTGIFGYAINEATSIAVDEVVNFLKHNPGWEVRFIVTNDNFPSYEKALSQANL